jgi:hypothetical protein
MGRAQAVKAQGTFFFSETLSTKVDYLGTAIMADSVNTR